jgi:hypothetical protein
MVMRNVAMRARLMATCVALACVALACVALPGGLAVRADTIAVSDQNFIATPSATGVKILLDLFPFEARVKSEPEAQRGAMAEAVARQAIGLYLKELDDVDRKDITQAEIVLVYVRQRDEYKKPRVAAMAEIGKLQAVIENGTIKAVTPVTKLNF